MEGDCNASSDSDDSSDEYDDEYYDEEEDGEEEDRSGDLNYAQPSASQSHVTGDQESSDESLTPVLTGIDRTKRAVG